MGEETSRAKRIAIRLALTFLRLVVVVVVVVVGFFFFHLVRFSLAPLSAPGSPRMGLAVAAGCWPGRVCGRI